MSKEKEYDASVDVEMEGRSSIEILRDDSQAICVGSDRIGRITSYKFKILVRNKPALEGEMTREEVDIMFRLYAAEGSSLTQRTVSTYFPRYTFQEFKKIIKAFNLTKASAPVAPHVLEERPLDELVELTLQNKENDFLKKLEHERSKRTEKRLKELTKEYLEFKEKVSDFQEFLSDLHINGRVEINKPVVTTKKTIIVYLSDMHIGAKVPDWSIYNNQFDYAEAQRRMEKILDRVKELATFTGATNIIICNVGDSLDGMNAQTTRGGHLLPQNMENREQIDNFTQLMISLFANLSSCGLFNSIKYFCVAGGNHDGDFGYAANRVVEGFLKTLNPEIETRIFTKFIEYFTCENHTFILCHGKDEKDMFKNLPLVLNDKTENQINEFLNYNNITGNVHFIKGDLHQSAKTYGKRFRYKSVGSFFGSSDWIHKNFGNTPALVDIDIIDGDNILETLITLNWLELMKIS